MANAWDYAINEEQQKSLEKIWDSISLETLDLSPNYFFNFVEKYFPECFLRFHLDHLYFITYSSFTHKDGYIKVQNKDIDDSVDSFLLRDSLGWLEDHRLICILRNGWERKLVSFLSSHKFFTCLPKIKEKEKNKFLESFWPFWKDLKLE